MVRNNAMIDVNGNAKSQVDPRVPDAMQRGTKWSGASLIRDRTGRGVRNDPGSAAHHFAFARAALRPEHTP